MMNGKDLLHKRLVSINGEVEESIENQYEHYRHFTVDSQDGIAHTLRYGDVTWAEFEAPSIDISLKELTKLLNAVHTKGFELHETFEENRKQVQQKTQSSTTQPKADFQITYLAEAENTNMGELIDRMNTRNFDGILTINGEQYPVDNLEMNHHDVEHSMNGESNIVTGISGEIHQTLRNQNESRSISIPRRPFLQAGNPPIRP